MNPLKQAEHFFALRAQWLGEGGSPVDQMQSQARADVCIKCPFNEARPIEEIFKGMVALIVKRQIQLKNQMNLRVDGEKSLHICAKCDCVLRLKVHTPLKFILEHTKTDDLPEWCWIRKEQENL